MSKTYLELYTRQQANEELINKGELDAVEAGHISTTGTESNAAVLALLQQGGFDWKGTWLPDVTYRKNQVVQHDGSAWIAKDTSIGVEPSPTALPSWDLFTSQGEQGNDGVVTIAQDWANLFGRNAADVTIGTAAPVLLASLEGRTDRDTYAQILNTTVINVTTPGLLEVWYNLDQGAYNGILSKRVKYTAPVGWYTIDHSFVQRQIVGPADFYLDMYARFTGGSGAATVAARGAELTALSAGIVGGASNKRPNFWIEETVNVQPLDLAIPAMVESVSVTTQLPLTLSAADASVETELNLEAPAISDDWVSAATPITATVTGTMLNVTAGQPNYTYNLTVGGFTAASFTTSATGTATVDLAAIFSLTTGTYLVKVTETSQTYTVTV